MSGGSGAISQSGSHVAYIGLLPETRRFKPVMQSVSNDQRFSTEMEKVGALQLMIARLSCLNVAFQSLLKNLPGYHHLTANLAPLSTRIAAANFEKGKEEQDSTLVEAYQGVWRAADEMLHPDYMATYKTSWDALKKTPVPMTSTGIVNRIGYVVYVILHSYRHLDGMENLVRDMEKEGMKNGTLRPPPPPEPPEAPPLAANGKSALAEKAAASDSKAQSATAAADGKSATAAKTASSGSKGASDKQVGMVADGKSASAGKATSSGSKTQSAPADDPKNYMKVAKNA